MADQAKAKRGISKGLFTKAQKKLCKALEDNADVEIIEGRMSDVKKAYNTAQERHEEYMSALGISEQDANFATEDSWISSLDDEYDEIERKKVAYVRKVKTEPQRSDGIDSGKQTESHQSQLIAIRQIEVVAFNTILDSLKDKIKLQMSCDEPILDIIKEEFSDLKRQFESCKQAHHKYITVLPNIPKDEIQWAGLLQDKVLKMSAEFSKLMEKKEDKKRSGISHEKLKMPTFDGNIRDYPRFKADFERQILPKYKKDSHGAAYALKSCLSKEPLNIVRNVDDDHTEMWKRLDEKYGSKSRFTDAIMTEIKGLEPVYSGNNKGFINLVTIVESGFRDLERLNLAEEMANSTAVSMIEEKLPPDIRKFWALEISKVDTLDKGKDKFAALLEFLLNHKRAMEYDLDNIRAQNNTSNRNKHTDTKGTVNLVDLNNNSSNTIHHNSNNGLYHTPDSYSNQTTKYDPYSNQITNFTGNQSIPTYQVPTYNNDQLTYNGNSQYGISDNNVGPLYTVQGGANYFQRNMPLPPPPPRNRSNNDGRPPLCCIHRVASHTTAECKNYIAMSKSQKVDAVRSYGLCFSCLSRGHRSFECNVRKKCGIDRCDKFHHHSLHEGSVEGLGFHANGHPGNGVCLLQIMTIETPYETIKSLTVFFDGGATISLIKFETASKLGLQGEEVMLSVTKVGGEKERLKSLAYELQLLDRRNRVVEFRVYGIEKISTEIKTINVQGVMHLFDGVRKNELKRPSGEIDVLIGYEYAGFHPVRQQASGHLLLLSSRFGKCLGGSHPLLSEYTRKVIQHVQVHHVDVETTIEDFYNIEAMGVNCNPKCGGCKCGRCPIGGKDYTLKEERELNMIDQGLTHQGDHWLAKYPWIRDPNELIDNYHYALGRLRSLEKTLSKNPEHARVYQEQIEDMVDRNVARKLTKEEIETYKGPVYYIPHHAVWKDSSESTPCRPVMDSSANCRGTVLNEFWAKGPDLINNLLGVLLRFREGFVAITGDIRKMYHAVKISGVDQHTHRFLWRDMDMNSAPSIYVMTSVSFGDKPAGNMAIMALRKTALMNEHLYPEAADTVLRNSYVDDIADSVDSLESAQERTNEIDDMLQAGGFKIKKWTYTSNGATDNNNTVNVITEFTIPSSSHPPGQKLSNHKILGMKWDPEGDLFSFEIKLNFAPKRKNTSTQFTITINIDILIPIPLTKRMIVSQVNRMYDPVGLIGPFLLRAKLLMRELWKGIAKALGWDDVIPEDHLAAWMKFFHDLLELKDLTFPRCIRPADAVGNPSLVIFCDGSNDAFGACAYVRWERECGSYQSYLIASKNRLTPLKRMTPVRSELCGAVIAKRLKVLIRKEMRLEFENEYFIMDSQIVHAMLQKDSYGFNTFAGVRIGEIQEETSPSDFYWMERCHNIADWVTHGGRSPRDLERDSEWQQGPAFLKLPVSEWPTRHEPVIDDLPEQVRVVMSLDGEKEETLSDRIDLDRFSKYWRLVRTTARVLAMYKRSPKLSLYNASNDLNSNDIGKAENFWFLEAQKSMKAKLLKGDFNRLCPTTNEDGIVVVGGRAEKWFRHRFDKETLVLLPYQHRFTKLYAEQMHIDGGHLAEAATISKIRSRVWIPRIRHMVNRITTHCVTCRKKNKKLEEQRMSTLPLERLKPCPPWSYTSLDFIGPWEVRGEVNKRSRGKAYGVLFNCITCRAVYLDIAADYSTEGFLLALRRFVSLRGYPSIIYSDPGSQLEAASKELKNAIKGLNKEEIKAFGQNKGLDWKFSPADGPWQNGCSEALVKSVKKALEGSVGKQILTVNELQTVCFEAANLVNERPIGRHPTDPSDGVYLCPNQLLLGRASGRVPSGPFKEHSNLRQRHRLVQNIADSFWRQWTRDFFPSLLVRQKWHVERRNVKVGDVVIVQDSKQLRGNWKLASVSRVFPSDDGKVRRVELQYKNEKVTDAANEYTGTSFTKIERPIQKIVVIVPVDYDQEDED